MDLGKVASVNPKEWSGSINLGGNIQTGNTDRRGATVAAEVIRKTETDRFRVQYLFNYAQEKGETTTRNQYGDLEYNYFFTKKLYAYGAVELLNDKFKDYRLRTIVGPGMGYQVWDDPVKSLSFEAGLSYENISRYEGKDDSVLTARLGGAFRYKFFDLIVFSERLLFYPSLGHGGDFIFRNEAALTVPLSARWALRLANIVDYDSNPTVGIKKTDSQDILSLQFSF